MTIAAAMRATMADGRCQATVYVRDTYRYTGRGKGGFEMHYAKQKCRRTALPNGYCWQHQDETIRRVGDE